MPLALNATCAVANLSKCTAGQLTPDRQVQLPAVQDGEKQSHSRTRRIRGEPKKQQEQETSDASASATMGPPEPSTEGENSEPRVYFN